MGITEREIKRIENVVREELKNPEMITHDFNHCERVATGAKWFVRILGGTKEEEKLGYVAGLLHDIVRPATEKIDHAVLSARKAEKILKEVGLSEETIKKIVLPVQDHRRPVSWISPLHQSVYLADKILEQMGAYIIFRRCVFVGECVDYKDKPFLWSIEHQFKKRLEKFDKNAFPSRFHRLVEYQYQWPEKFLEFLKERRKWAVRLGRKGYEIGKERSLGVDDFIKNFQPEDRESESIWREALNYINGKKFKEFEGLIRFYKINY